MNTEPRQTPNAVEPVSVAEQSNANSSTLAHLVAVLPSLQFGLGLFSATIVIAALYLGREILMPLAMAFLLGFVLDPLVVRLKRWGVPRAVAVIVVVVATLALIVAAGLLLSRQVSALSAELPTYQSNIQSKLRDFLARANAPGMFDGAMKTFEAAQKEVESSTATAQSGKSGAAPAQRVQIQEKETTPQARALQWFEVAGGPLVNAGIVLVFLVLVLLDRQDLRDRLLRLLGGNLHRTTDAMDEAGVRISKYLTMQLIVNASYGVPMAIGLWLIGVPAAILWGAVAAVMRFVPYVGPMLSAVFPLALAFAVDPGWSMVLWTIGLIALLELLSNNVVEPWLYGTSTGLSAISLMVAATFWATLWGPIGLVLSTPLTVCLLVIGRHLPHLQFLDVLLGSQPALELPTRIYQRLLAGDVEDAIELATEQVDAGSAADFYHRIGIPVLRLASGDHDSVATAEHRHRIVSGMHRVIDELREQQPAPVGAGRPQVVCIGGKWEVDTLAARMLAHALGLAGVTAEHRAAGVSNADLLTTLDLLGATTVCLSHFSPEPQTQVRYLCRRLRRRWPDLHIVLALWNAPVALLDEAGYKALGADAVATSIDETVMRVSQQLREALGEDYLPAPVPEADIARLRALRASGILDDALRERFNLVAKRAADSFDMPLALVSLIEESTQQVRGAAGALVASTGDGSAGADGLEIARSLSMCGHVVASADTVVVEDIARDPRFANNPVLRGRSLRFYAGAPLRDAEGHVYGSLCVLDTKPRIFDEPEIRLLESMAAELMESLQLTGPNATTVHTEAADTSVSASPGAADVPSATVGQLVPD